ncbi:MAG: 30S ribosomal protein S6 [Candidatus Harrisonbacteria bacterium]|nr:30S ribosomal protein S6 [Candidatus Harrisonbacteria bacterium]
METDDRSRQYELAILMTNEGGEVEIDSLLAEFGKSHTLTVDSKDPAKLISLSYPINKHRSAILLVYRFTTETSVIALISQALRHREGVLRNLIITPPVFNQPVPVKRGTQEEGNRESELSAEKENSAEKASKEAVTNEDLAAVLQELSQ